MLKAVLITLAVLLLVFLILVVGVVLFIRAKLRGALLGLKQAMEQMATLGQMVPPPEIHLARQAAIDWHHPAEVATQTDALLAAGFVDAGTYTVDEMPGLRMRGFVNPLDRAYAVIYDHPERQPWWDVVVRYAGDGPYLTYSTAEDTGLSRPPDKPVTRVPGVDAVELHRRLQADRSPGELAPVSPETFVSMFERYYAEEMAWRAQRGLSAEEVRAQAAKAGVEPDDATIRQVQTLFRARLTEGLREELRQAFLQATSMTAVEWEAVKDRLVVIHDRMTEEEVVAAFGTQFEDGADEDETERQIETLRQRLRETTPRVAFASQNNVLPSDRRLEPLGEVETPIPADFYRGRVETNDV